jgi:hypothetical protein
VGDFIVNSVIAGVGGSVDIEAEVPKRMGVGGILIAGSWTDILLESWDSPPHLNQMI